MQRMLLIALVLASCSKAKKDAAPATAAEPPKQDTTGNAGPGEGGGGQDRGRDAVEHARNQGGLGVSAHTDSFDPLPEPGSGSGKGGPTADRKVKPTEPPQPVVGGAPGFVATIDAVTVDGKPASAEITQAVKVTSAEIQVCYDKARSTNTKKADLVGTLKIAFTVLKTGAISGAAIEGKALGYFEMENCVMEALSRMKLAKPPADKVKAVATITFAKK